MPIPSDHVVGEKEPVRKERAANLIEKQLKFEKMMQALDCHNHVILPGRFPGVDVKHRKCELISVSLFGCRLPSSIENFRIEIKTFELKISNILFKQPLRDVDFRCGVPCADTQDDTRLLRMFSANAGNVGSEHLDRTPESEALKDRNHVIAEPVVRDRGKIVDIFRT